jgi:hypothetical protein
MPSVVSVTVINKLGFELQPSSVPLTQTVTLDFIVLTILVDPFKAQRSSFHKILNWSRISSLLGPDIFLGILFSDTCNLCSFLKLRYHISHIFKTRGEIVILYI